MVPPVLQRVERRRRRRRRGPVLLLAAAALAAGAGAGVWLAWFRGGESRPAETAAARPVPRRVRPVPRPVPQRPRPKPPPPLLVAPRPPAHGGFRPPLTARAAILVDAGTGSVLWTKRPHERLPIASTTKIMTAVLVLERLRAGQIVTVHPSVPRVAPFKEGLRAGERVAVWKLLYGLMLYSGNDDALALAIASGGTRAAFIELMNAKTRALGLRDTRFSTPSGVIDEGNYSSAWDLAALTRYALRKPRFRKIVRARKQRVSWAAPTYAKIYVNKNHLLGRYQGADGVKTGWTTKAGHCFVASATRHGIRLVAVVLGARDAPGDATRLLDLGFRIRG